MRFMGFVGLAGVYRFKGLVFGLQVFATRVYLGLREPPKFAGCCRVSGSQGLGFGDLLRGFTDSRLYKGFKSIVGLKCGLVG